jgi:hypothetical protein
MTTKAPARPWRSGFCAPRNPASSHAKCDSHPRGDGVPCVCECHEVAEPEVLTLPEHAAGSVIDDMPEQDYHTHPTSLSQSGAKVLLRSPALYQWQRTHPVFKSAWDEGSAAHKLVLKAGPEIVEVKHDSWRTNAAKAEQAAARAEGKIPLLSAKVRMVEDMAEALTRHRLAMSLLAEGGKAEVSLFAVDEATGVLRRGRTDFHNAVEHLLVDYKTSTTADPDEFQRTSVAKFGYHIQHPYYVDLARDLGFPIRSMVFIVQEKEPPYQVSVVELTPDAVEAGRARARRALQMYRDCTESGLWPSYVPDDTITAIDIPEWAYAESREA